MYGNSNLKLTPIKDICGEFDIKDYQRGYRWTDNDVGILLSDIETYNNESNNGSIYCLQPIVLKKTGENKFELIDG